MKLVCLLFLVAISLATAEDTTMPPKSGEEATAEDVATVAPYLSTFDPTAPSSTMDPTPSGTPLFFEGCSLADYYAPLLAQGPPETWTRAMVARHLTLTQRNILPATSPVAGGDDIFTALMDLDEGSNENVVRLVYRNIDMAKLPYSTPQSWSVERLYPVERGATRESGAAYDVHNLRAADRSVQINKQGQFFGECGTVEDLTSCIVPATDETPDDTAQDDKIFTPPAVHRGDIARSLFYVQLRYNEELGLLLSDCSPFIDGEFGYLSPLLEWAVKDPVSEGEIERNQKACERWQGNRNIFVDYPQLVEQFFGVPDVVTEGTTMYSMCVSVTSSPTAVPRLPTPAPTPFFTFFPTMTEFSPTLEPSVYSDNTPSPTGAPTAPETSQPSPSPAAAPVAVAMPSEQPSDPVTPPPTTADAPSSPPQQPTSDSRHQQYCRDWSLLSTFLRCLCLLLL